MTSGGVNRASAQAHLPFVPAVPATLREQIYRECAELDAQEQTITVVQKRADLKQLLNSFLPVHSLPTELLVQIISEFHSIYDQRTKGFIEIACVVHRRRRLVGTDRFMVRLMSVCRRWRDAFVSTPEFWRRIDLGRHVEWTSLCLVRSLPASVDVVARAEDVSHLDVLHPHVHRFRTFVFFSASGNSTTLPPLFGSGMSLLEGLYLNDSTPGSGDDHPDIPLTSQRFPRLNALVLLNTFAPQDIPLFARLKKLKLNRCRILHLEGFLDALAASVQLEELFIGGGTLSNISPGEWARNPGPLRRRPPTPTVLLPRLRAFTLIGNGVTHTSRFLAHLYLQPSVAVKIGADARLGLQTVPGDDYPSTTLSYSAMLPPDPSATLPSLAMATDISLLFHPPRPPREQDSFCELRYEYPTAAGLPPSWEPQVATLSLELRGSEGDALMRTALDDLVRCFRRSPIRSLVVWGDHAYGTAAAWARIFRAFPLLEELAIDSSLGQPPSDVTVVFRGLHTASMSRTDGDTSGSIACPNLREVFVRGAGTVETYEALRECFRWRGERGAVTEVLDLRSMQDHDDSISDIRRALVDYLRGAVDNLDT